MHHDIKAQPIMLSHYLQEENKDVVSDKRLDAIANGSHPRPSYKEVVNIAKELITRRNKDGDQRQN